MNKLELERVKMKNWRAIDSMPFRPKVNNVEIDINNSIEHELLKAISVILIRNGVEVDNLPHVLSADLFFEGIDCWGMDTSASLQNHVSCTIATLMRNIIKKYGHKFKNKWEVPDVVTEARMKNGRRIDVYVLNNGKSLEIECGKRTKPDSITVRANKNLEGEKHEVL